AWSGWPRRPARGRRCPAASRRRRARPASRPSRRRRRRWRGARPRTGRRGPRHRGADRMPCRPRVPAVTRPAGPAPAITTGSCRARSAPSIALLLFLSLAEALDGQDAGRVDARAGVGQRLDHGPEPGPPGGLAVVVGLVGVVGVVVPERRGPGRGGGERLAHGVSPLWKRLLWGTMRRRADVALPVHCGAASAGGSDGGAVQLGGRAGG